jgi:RTA1 like protein
MPECINLSPECPPSESIYGYAPSLSANAFFAAFFGTFMVINIFFGIRYRSWTFLIAMAVGCMTECLGYVGRVLLHSNPFSNPGFEIQICCLTLAPAFFAGGIYLTLKHIVICFGREKSYLKPKYYTWLFISCDFLSLVLQGSGGGIAATSIHDHSRQKVGNDLMMAGISFQAITMLAFGIMAATYFIRLARSATPLSAAAESVKNSTRFRLFAGGFLFALISVFTRCVYRIAEMSGGWGNKIMQSETDFMVLDSV